MYILQFVLFVCILNVECLRKSIAKVVARTGLQCLAVMHQRFDGVGSFCTGEFLFVCLSSFYNRDCQYLLAEICVHIQHLDSSFLSLFGCCMCRMSFLPQELSGAQERSCCFLPANNRTPLIIYFWQISVRLNVFCIKITEQGLRCRTHTQSLLKRFQTAVSYPCNLRCKSFHMIFLFLKKTFRNKHRKIYILYPSLLESSVQLMLNIFPDCITGRFDDHASFYAGVIYQLCFFHYIRIPLCEIFVHGCNGFY